MNRISLCVPTYSRADQLGPMLRQLMKAVAGHRKRERFEICISDNASVDNTADVILWEIKDHESLALHHKRQATNIGFAGNFAAVARLSTGDAFVVLADDDELRPEALDTLLMASELVTESSPLVLFDTLPGGDAVFRGMSRPTKITTIQNPHHLLQRLGIFHATFVSNLMFHRETALAKLMPAMLRSRYPHTALALSMLQNAPATFVPGKLVNVTLPADTGDQPLLTCVDMAHVMSDYALVDSHCRGLAWHVYRFLLKMLPTAIYQQRIGRCVGDANNPHADLRLSSVRYAYRHSLFARILATIMWFVARCLPLYILGALLRRVSRHSR